MLTRMRTRSPSIPGDGTGPELTEAARRVLEATGVEFDWDVQRSGRRRDGRRRNAAAGGDARLDPARTGSPSRGRSRRRSGPASAPSTSRCGTSSGCTRCLRPCKSYPGVRSRYDNVDLVVVRENTEDLYAGIEYEAGTADAARVIEMLNGMQAKQIAPTPGISVKPISPEGAERIIRYAFEYARTARPQAGLRASRRQHHEVHRRPVPVRLPRGRAGLPRDRAVGDARRRALHGARAEARGVRRARAAEPLRRHHQRPHRRPRRRPRRRSRRQHRRRTRRSSRRRTARRRSTRARTRSTRPR